ncbi:MAG: hypothetical protein M3N68_06410 [Actinomycetota bacterium]|nr:hypothetical protein [Actinomycetota bacterium]
MSWVRVTFGQGPPRCAVAGVSHRRPVLRAVTFHTATQLVASGVPVVIRHLPSRRQTSPAGGAEAIAAGPPSRV